jgi:hypothetical protein
MEQFIVIVGETSQTDSNGDTYARAYGPFDWEAAHEVASNFHGDRLSKESVSVVPVARNPYAPAAPALAALFPDA